MYQYQFPRPSVTATAVIMNPHASHVLLGRRSANASAYPSYWSLPGGFLDARVDANDVVDPTAKTRDGETIEETMIREIFEETNIVVEKSDLKLFHVSSNPATDPRAHVINVCFKTTINESQMLKARPGDDLEELDWFRLNNMNAWPGLAFNHRDIVRASYRG